MRESNSQLSTVFDIQEILKILPHRYPFLLVDRVIHLDLNENLIIGLKNVTMNEFFFQGHFPEVPIMPGVLLLEALAQVGGILIHQKGFAHKIALLLNVNNAKFRKPVKPGDQIHLQAKALHLGSRAGKVQGTALVDGQVVAEAEIGFVLMEKGQLSPKSP